MAAAEVYSPIATADSATAAAAQEGGVTGVASGGLINVGLINTCTVRRGRHDWTHQRVGAAAPLSPRMSVHQRLYVEPLPFGPPHGMAGGLSTAGGDG